MSELHKKIPVIVIYSCKKYKSRHELLYSSIKCKADLPVYICYGDPTISESYILDDKYIVLKCDDGYNALSYKTRELVEFTSRHFTQYCGLIKMDDDMHIHFSRLYEFIDSLNGPEIINYTGFIVTINKETMSTHHFKNNSNNNKQDSFSVPKCKYAGGPLYYLSMPTILLLTRHTDDCEKKTRLIYHPYEDIMIGLSCKNLEPPIFPIDSKLTYNDNCTRFIEMPVHNIMYKYIFTRLHGGIGNQLFQIAATYGLALRHYMLPYFWMTPNPNHNITGISNTIIEQKIPIVSDSVIRAFIQDDTIDNKALLYNNELRGENCLVYKNIITRKACNYILDAYLQNEKYFGPIKKHIIDLFYNNDVVNKHYSDFPDLLTSYFIHIRLGDYTEIPMYTIDYKTYFLKCLNMDPTAHYYIVSNDIEKCRTYDWLMQYNITFINNMSDYDTLYFMAAAGKGGICSNSTFSWWGAYLNKNENKKIYFPRKWLNNNWVCDIWFTGSNIVDI